MKNIIKDIRESHNMSKAQFSRLLGVTGGAITRWENGERTPDGPKTVGALLRVAQPEQQKALLEALGIEDVEQFAADILASAGVLVLEMETEQRDRFLELLDIEGNGRVVS